MTHKPTEAFHSYLQRSDGSTYEYKIKLAAYMLQTNLKAPDLAIRWP